MDMVGDLAETIGITWRRDEMDRIENRRRGGGYVSEAAYSGEMPRTMTRRAEPRRGEEGALKRFFKSVFLTVSGDINDIF